jgi:hypothetical protein
MRVCRLRMWCAFGYVSKEMWGNDWTGVETEAGAGVLGAVSHHQSLAGTYISRFIASRPRMRQFCFQFQVRRSERIVALNIFVTVMCFTNVDMPFLFASWQKPFSAMKCRITTTPRSRTMPCRSYCPTRVVFPLSPPCHSILSRPSSWHRRQQEHRSRWLRVQSLRGSPTPTAHCF